MSAFEREILMNETSKSKLIWGDLERSVLCGEGIDIGCGPDPVMPGAVAFDIKDGDANHITRFVSRTFDFVYSSHCLEHMRDPPAALAEWWKLVKPGGHLFFTVPDEDLYEQGVFPSRFNDDHKSTFTISKSRSWSPCSFNVLNMALSLENSRLVKLELQDHGYDRGILKHGGGTKNPVLCFFIRKYQRFRRIRGYSIPFMEYLEQRFFVIDQTLNSGVLAQIQCIIRKTS